MEDFFVVVYDIRDEGLGWGPCVVLLWLVLAVSISVIGIVLARRRREVAKVALISVVLMAFFCLGGFGVFNVTYQRWRCLRWAKRGEFHVVVGEVKDFIPQKREGGPPETFTVGGERFSYSGYDLAKGGFNHTSVTGGPMRGGLYVRISHHDGQILKIEVRK